MEILLTHYGPIAFGVAALLIIWKQIVGPEMAVARASTTEERKLLTSNVAALQNIADQLMTCHETNKAQTMALTELVKEVRNLKTCVSAPPCADVRKDVPGLGRRTDA